MENYSNEIRDVVRETYSKVVENASSYHGSGHSPDKNTGCCSLNQSKSFYEASSRIGYSDKELFSVPEGSNLGLGCGNPQAIASLKKGDIVLDLGSGAG